MSTGLLGYSAPVPTDARAAAIQDGAQADARHAQELARLASERDAYRDASHYWQIEWLKKEAELAAVYLELQMRKTLGLQG